MKKLFLFAFLIFGVNKTYARIADDDSCVHNSDIKVETTSTKIKLSWINVCDDSQIQKYKIHYNHDGYLACNDGRKDLEKPAGFGTIETRETEVWIEDLHPYSNYSIDLTVLRNPLPESGKRRIRPDRYSVEATTEFSIPKAKAQPSPIDYSYKNTATKLVFNWSPPLLSSQCDLFYSQLGSYVYILRGIDPWNREDFREDILDTTQTQVEISDLKPFSNYIFFLYLANDAKEYDSDVYLKLEGMTLPTQPQPPEFKTVESIGDKTVHLEWMPASPPTGELSHYEVRWTLGKLQARTAWLDSKRVEPGDALCSDEHPDEGTACFTVYNLEPGNYTFQIRTFNKDVVEHSEWSEKFNVELTSEELEYGNQTGGYTFIYIGLFIVLFIISVAAIFFFYRRCRRDRSKKGFEMVNKDEQPQLRPIFRNPNSRFSDTSSYTLRSAQDPLPSVPPVENIYSELKGGEVLEDKLILPGMRTQLELDEEHYLKPNNTNHNTSTLTNGSLNFKKAQSTDSLDEEGYLKPNFNRYQRMNTSGSENGGNAPPTIPAVSYMAGGGISSPSIPENILPPTFVPGKPSEV